MSANYRIVDSRTSIFDNTDIGRCSTYFKVYTIEKLLLFYEAYISKCCLRPFYDEYGNVYIVVDMELKGRIREALLKMICEFEIDEH